MIYPSDATPADDQVKPWQRQLSEGDCFVYRSASTNRVTWGEVLERPTPSESNYRFCRLFSSANVEDGYVHVAAIHSVVPPELFARARTAGWPDDDLKLLSFALKLSEN